MSSTVSTNASSTKETITQLNQARGLCLADPNNLYPQIVPGLAPIVHADAALALRRWGAEFLSETFASPVLAAEHKQKLGVLVLDQLASYLERKDEDAAVVKSAVQAAASIYPFVFRHIIATPQDAGTWQKMAGIKSSILRRMDTAPAGVRISCIKFVQAVVQVQTPGMIADPRRPEQNEISLALVPRDHPVIPPPNLEAEASGLLDRLLDALQSQSSDALFVTATLNALGSLVRRRASVANKIITAIVNFDPFVLASPTMTLKDKIMVKSMTRTTIAFLTNIIKRTPSHSMAGRVQGRIDKLRQALIDVFDELSRKRTAPVEPTDGLSDAKRRRLGAEIPMETAPQRGYPPLPSGVVSSAQLYTLTQDQSLQNFDVKILPLDIVLKLVPPLLGSVDQAKLNAALDVVRARLVEIQGRQPLDAGQVANIAIGNTVAEGDDEEEYEPNLPTTDAQQVLNELADTGDDLRPPEALPTELAPLELPPPPPLTEEDTMQSSKNVVGRVFGVLQSLDTAHIKRTQKLGLNRLAGANRDRDAWMTLLSRLATRASAGLAVEDSTPTTTDAVTTRKQQQKMSPSDTIREALYMYTLEDFRSRRRIDVAISWLNEEWYNDQVALKQVETDQRSQADATNGTVRKPALHYDKWLGRLLDGILPYIEARDKLLIRFLAEIPALDRVVIARVTKLAADPESVSLVVMALHYLVLYRPPIREMCLDAMEELYNTYDAKAVAKTLAKWRPGPSESDAGADPIATTNMPVVQRDIKVE